MIVEFSIPLVDFENENKARSFIEGVLPSDYLMQLRVTPTDDYLLAVAEYEFDDELEAKMISQRVIYKLEDAELPFTTDTRLNFDPDDLITL